MTRKDLDKIKEIKKAQKDKNKEFAKMSKAEKDELLETIAKMLGLI